MYCNEKEAPIYYLWIYHDIANIFLKWMTNNYEIYSNNDTFQAKTTEILMVIIDIRKPHTRPSL